MEQKGSEETSVHGTRGNACLGSLVIDEGIGQVRGFRRAETGFLGQLMAAEKGKGFGSTQRNFNEIFSLKVCQDFMCKICAKVSISGIWPPDGASVVKNFQLIIE